MLFLLLKANLYERVSYIIPDFLESPFQVSLVGGHYFVDNLEATRAKSHIIYEADNKRQINCT